MKKLNLVLAAIAAVLATVMITPAAQAEEQHPTFGCDDSGCWMERELPAEKSARAFLYDHDLVLGAAGGYLGFAEAEDGYGLGVGTLAYRFLDRELRMGFEVGGGLGTAGSEELAVTANPALVWYPHKHLGLGLGYSYFRACAIGRDDPAQAHMGQITLRLAVVSWLEIQLWGQAGYGWWVKPETRQYLVEDQYWRVTADRKSHGLVGGGGGGFAFPINIF